LQQEGEADDIITAPTATAAIAKKKLTKKNCPNFHRFGA
jgi:hypothetical protein